MTVIKEIYGLESGVLFHLTSIKSLFNILKNNEFLLSKFDAHPSESLKEEDPELAKFYEKYAGNLYYLSTARSLTSSYYKGLPSLSAMIVLDKNKLKRRYKIIPFVYKYFIGSRDEAEDRIVSDKPYIKNASSYIKHVILYIYPEVKTLSDENLRQVLLLPAIIRLLKKQNIPYSVVLVDYLGHDAQITDMKGNVSNDDFLKLLKVMVNQASKELSEEPTKEYSKLYIFHEDKLFLYLYFLFRYKEFGDRTIVRMITRDRKTGKDFLSLLIKQPDIYMKIIYSVIPELSKPNSPFYPYIIKLSSIAKKKKFESVYSFFEYVSEKAQEAAEELYTMLFKNKKHTTQ